MARLLSSATSKRNVATNDPIEPALIDGNLASMEQRTSYSQDSVAVGVEPGLLQDQILRAQGLACESCRELRDFQRLFRLAILGCQSRVNRKFEIPNQGSGLGSRQKFNTKANG